MSYIQHKKIAGSALRKCGNDPDVPESSEIPPASVMATGGAPQAPPTMIDLTIVIDSRR